jgi:hypothetical protein
LRNPVTSRELALLRKVQFDGEALLALHEQRLTELLRHAWTTTDYYRRVLAEAGVVRDDGAVDLSRFTDIPCLTKDIIRSEFDRLTSRALPRGAGLTPTPPAGPPASRPGSCRTTSTGT